MADDILGILARVKVYKVTECDYVVAQDADQATAFVASAKLNPSDVYGSPRPVDLTTNVWFPLEEELEDKPEENPNYVDPSYTVAPPTIMKELLLAHINDGFVIPAFIYCRRHFIHTNKLV